MKLRAPLTMALAAAVVVLTAGTAWAGPHGGVAATVAPDGTGVFTTTNGPAPNDIEVSLASYTGLWKGQTEPEKLYRVVHGTIAAGTSRLVLHVEVPSCGPFQMDAFLGSQVPATISYPQGSGPNGLKGQEYPHGAPCTTPTPTTSPSASVSPTKSSTHHPSPSTSVLGTKIAAGADLAATGPVGVGSVAVLGAALLLLGLAALVSARRARRH
jgi:hypothetical protein